MKPVSLALALALAAALSVPRPSPAATTYVVDKNHSDVSFTIRHLVSKVRGRFSDFSATIVRDDADPTKSSVELHIQIASVDTKNESRDSDLRTDHFFDVAKYPEMVFKSTGVEKTEGGYSVTGDLSMHGVTKSIVLPVTFDGEMKDARGQTRAGFSTSTTIQRKEFGINWNVKLDNGGFLLSDEVEVTIGFEAVAQ